MLISHVGQNPSLSCSFGWGWNVVDGSLAGIFYPDLESHEPRGDVPDASTCRDAPSTHHHPVHRLWKTGSRTARSPSTTSSPSSRSRLATSFCEALGTVHLQGASSSKQFESSRKYGRREQFQGEQKIGFVLHIIFCVLGNRYPVACCQKRVRHSLRIEIAFDLKHTCIDSCFLFPSANKISRKVLRTYIIL